ncbi:MAG: hypothetical protein JNK75_07685 [Betaproteobacteria bacterium]|nr:hypothetical protein [Betaproteobacteria bacterium]
MNGLNRSPKYRANPWQGSACPSREHSSAITDVPGSRPLPRGDRKSVKPKAACRRCQRFSFLASDAGQPCRAVHRESVCTGVLAAASGARDWLACQWCAGFGWHRGMCCAKCTGSGWVRAAPAHLHLAWA